MPLKRTSNIEGFWGHFQGGIYCALRPCHVDRQAHGVRAAGRCVPRTFTQGTQGGSHSLYVGLLHQSRNRGSACKSSSRNQYLVGPTPPSRTAPLLACSDFHWLVGCREIQRALQVIILGDINVVMARRPVVTTLDLAAPARAAELHTPPLAPYVNLYRSGSSLGVIDFRRLQAALSRRCHKLLLRHGRYLT